MTLGMGRGSLPRTGNLGGEGVELEVQRAPHVAVGEFKKEAGKGER